MRTGLGGLLPDQLRRITVPVYGQDPVIFKRHDDRDTVKPFQPFPIRSPVKPISLFSAEKALNCTCGVLAATVPGYEPHLFR